jgi:hypothetical protein
MFELIKENYGQFGHSAYERDIITKIPLFLYFRKSGFASVNNVKSDWFNSSTVPEGAEVFDPRWLH